jgi:prefoldin subunit 5
MEKPPGVIKALHSLAKDQKTFERAYDRLSRSIESLARTMEAIDRANQAVHRAQSAIERPSRTRV